METIASQEQRLLNGLRPHLQAASTEAAAALCAQARLVLLGEASHGTEEFYAQRAAISRELIERHGFTAIVVEADWPDALRVDRYVRGRSDDGDAASALSGFERFPAWMWRNTVVRDFIEWLRFYNRGRAPQQQVGFYGMDLYSMFKSMRAVLAYLDRAAPEAAGRARSRYACFDHAHEDSQAYGYAASAGLQRSCEAEVVQQLREMSRHVAQDGDEGFFAQQNARLVRNAEAYYRTMFHGQVSSWNLRDQHMSETLQALDRHLGAPRMAVWAHNSHLGDAGATEMGDRGEWNVGQLVRERYGDQATLLGFGTCGGTVIAAHQWDEAAQRMGVRPGLPGSWEDLLHRTGQAQLLLDLRGDAALRELATPRRLQRAIGVIYRPETERHSHYYRASLAQQFDVFIHIDQTRALQPLDPDHGWAAGEVAETYPSGL